MAEVMSGVTEAQIADRGCPRGRVRISASMAHGRRVVVPLIGDFVARRLCAQGSDMQPSGGVDLGQEPVELVGFAAKPDQQHPASIGMLGQRREQAARAARSPPSCEQPNGWVIAWMPSTRPAWMRPARSAILDAVRDTQPTVGMTQISLRVAARPSARR